MAKEKKIGFRYFLQTNLKPTEDEGIKNYPVYVMITYDRKNTAFNLSMFDVNITCSKEDFERKFTEKEDPFIKDWIETLENRMTQIIRFETKVLEDKFTLVGLSHRRTAYNRYLIEEVERYLSQRLITEVYEKTKDKDVKNLYSEYFFIWDIYALLKDFFPNFKDLLSIELKMMLKAFCLFKVADFDDLILRKEKSVKLIDWLDNKIVMRYKESVLSFEGFQKHFVNESVNSPIWTLLNDINIDKKEIFKYLNVMDKLVAYSLS